MQPPEADKWGWRHVSVFGEFEKGSGTKRWKCNHCNIRYNGSYSRVRAHLLGFTGVGVRSCPAIGPALKESFLVLEQERSSARKKKNNNRDSDKTERPRKRAKASRQPGPREEVDEAVARFVYANGLDPGVVDSPFFRAMVEAVASHGSDRYRSPTAHEISSGFLDREKARIERCLGLVRESWPHTGISLLCVGTLQIHIFASSPRGLIFLKAFDTDREEDEDGSGNRFTGFLTGAVKEVGPANVVQIISRLELAAPAEALSRVFISRCTSRSVRSLMEEILETEWIKALVGCAEEVDRCLSGFVSFSPDSFPLDSTPPDSELAPFFSTVKRVFDMRPILEEAVPSEKWKEWKKLASLEDVSGCEATILEETFWGSAGLLVQLLEPFVRLHKELSIERFAIGDVCNWRVRSLEEVRRKGIRDVRASQFEELVERRWDSLFSPLHSASYVLNPRFFGRGQAKDKVTMRGWKAVVEKYEGESATNRRVLREQLSSYWRSEGSLGDEDAVDCRDKMDPVAWWENFGFETPDLQTMAIRVLGQVSSITMCEDICRDLPRLGVQRAEDFVFVRNNLRIHGHKNEPRNTNSLLLLE